MIYKNKIIYGDMKMSDVILNNQSLILVLERFEINLGFGDKTVEDICRNNNINIEVFLTISNLFNKSQFNNATNFNCEDIQTIIQYLKLSHKYYLEEKYPEISNSIKLMIEKNDNSETLMVKNFFKEYKNEVAEHIDYETNIVFPYIIDLFDKIKNKNNKNKKSNYSVVEYKVHHNDIEEKLTDLKNLLIKHLPQKNDIVIRRKILFNLFELEYDLCIHEKIEDNILIPLVEKMELKINNFNCE